jgi:hypothetical protein
MNTTLNILNNSFEYFENDMVIINLKTDEIIWKPNCFCPKYRNNIILLLKERKKMLDKTNIKY